MKSSYSYKLQLLLILLLITVNTTLSHPASGAIPAARSGAGIVGKLVKDTFKQGVDIGTNKAMDKISAAPANYGSSLIITSLFLGFAFVVMFN
ncbi:hypothetical protein QL285_073838 [Trifolium repens]|nr:hypothetical protein QL285_073838 [Trifolium repens]